MKENCIIIGIFKKSEKENQIERRLNEMKKLSITAGFNIIETFVQKIDKINATFYMGKGKLNELKSIIIDFNISSVIISVSLSSMQVRNLENELNVKIIDRSELILIIFAKNAGTNISSLEVELAQYKFLLSRLAGKGISLSRTGGGIGTRGPGEKKLEMDRRKIEQRIYILEKRLKKYEQDNNERRKNRKEIFNVSLFGYTNAGKTTIMNYLTKKKFITKNGLFTTLDTTTRKLYKNIVITDTIGFLGELPHELISSFQLTLKEAFESDLKIIVFDISDKFIYNTIEDVNIIMHSISKNNQLKLFVFNKIDNIVSFDIIERLKNEFPDSIFISAKTGENMNKLKEKILYFYYKRLKNIKLKIKKENIDLLNFLITNSIIKSQIENENYIFLNVYISNKKYGTFKKISRRIYED